jgi:hypothetical protein
MLVYMIGSTNSCETPYNHKLLSRSHDVLTRLELFAHCQQSLQRRLRFPRVRSDKLEDLHPNLGRQTLGSVMLPSCKKG